MTGSYFATHGYGPADPRTAEWIRSLAPATGAWRDPQRPEVLVVPHVRNEVYVYDEKTGAYGDWEDGDAHDQADQGHLAAAASRYFRDHDPAFIRARDAIWESLKPRLEDVINLDLNEPAQNEQFATLVADAARAVMKADHE